MTKTCYRLKVRLYIILPLTGQPEQQRFAMRSVVLTSTSRIVIAAQLLAAYCPKERTWTPSQPHYDLHPAMFPRNDSLFLVAVLPDANCYSSSSSSFIWEHRKVQGVQIK